MGCHIRICSICSRDEAAAQRDVERVHAALQRVRTARRDAVAKRCTGFTDHLPISGITDERSSLPTDLAENVRQLKSASAQLR